MFARNFLRGVTHVRTDREIRAEYCSRIGEFY